MIQSGTSCSLDGRGVHECAGVDDKRGKKAGADGV